MQENTAGWLNPLDVWIAIMIFCVVPAGFSQKKGRLFIQAFALVMVYGLCIILIRDAYASLGEANDTARITHHAKTNPVRLPEVWRDDFRDSAEVGGIWGRFLNSPVWINSPVRLALTERLRLVEGDGTLDPAAGWRVSGTGRPWAGVLVYGGLLFVLLWSGWLAYQEVVNRRETQARALVIQAREVMLAENSRNIDRAIKNWLGRLKEGGRIWLDHALAKLQAELEKERRARRAERATEDREIEESKADIKRREKQLKALNKLSEQAGANASKLRALALKELGL